MLILRRCRVTRSLQPSSHRVVRVDTIRLTRKLQDNEYKYRPFDFLATSPQNVNTLLASLPLFQG